MLELDISSIAPNPRSMAATGDDINVTFRCRSTVPGRFATRYVLFSDVPYRFDNTGTREVRVSQRPGSPTDTYGDTLRVRATGDTGATPQLQINVEVQELDASGNRIGPTRSGPCTVSILHLAVAAFRAANNLSQADLAERAGVSRSTISRLEQGGTPSDETHEAIERVLSEEAT